MTQTNPQIYIKGFPRSTRQKDLEEAFRKFGTIKECRIINGYAFIGFGNEDSMKEALKEMHNSQFEGSNIRVEAAGNPKRSQGPQPNDECRYCNKLGHWKNSCPEYRRRSGRDGGHRRNRSVSSSSSSSESDRRKENLKY